MGNSGIFTTLIVEAVIVLFGIILMTGRGFFLIAGFNTMSKEKKDQYDKEALCKFIGKCLFIIGLVLSLIVLGQFYNIAWLVYSSYIIEGLILAFLLVYTNTGNRFKKQP